MKTCKLVNINSLLADSISTALRDNFNLDIKSLQISGYTAPTSGDEIRPIGTVTDSTGDVIEFDPFDDGILADHFAWSVFGTDSTFKFDSGRFIINPDGTIDFEAFNRSEALAERA